MNEQDRRLVGDRETKGARMSASKENQPSDGSFHFGWKLDEKGTTLVPGLYCHKSAKATVNVGPRVFSPLPQDRYVSLPKFVTISGLFQKGVDAAELVLGICNGTIQRFDPGAETVGCGCTRGPEIEITEDNGSSQMYTEEKPEEKGDVPQNPSPEGVLEKSVKIPIGTPGVPRGDTLFDELL